MSSKWDAYLLGLSPDQLLLTVRIKPKGCLGQSEEEQEMECDKAASEQGWREIVGLRRM